MGRTDASYAPLAQQGFRKDQRAKHARATISKLIPQLLASDAKARNGIAQARLIVNPQRETSSRSSDEQPAAAGTKGKAKTPKKGKRSKDADTSIDSTPSASTANEKLKKPPLIKIQIADTLVAAQHLHRNSRSRKNIAVLNMASPLRPGGGVLNGATSQEESLCTRTTLLPSLKEEWYRLPEVGGIFSPDVLVFRTGDAHSSDQENLPKNERFYIDVITAAMLRFPDTKLREASTPAPNDDDHSNTNSGGEEEEDTTTHHLDKIYANPTDRDLALLKTRAIITMLTANKSTHAILGPWGCGAYGNPLTEICTAWKRALLGTTRSVGAAPWGSLRQVVFAVRDERMARAFARCWDDGVVVERVGGKDGEAREEGEMETGREELRRRIAELEGQVGEVRTPLLREGLEKTLESLRKQLRDDDGEGGSTAQESDDGESSEEE